MSLEYFEKGIGIIICIIIIAVIVNVIAVIILCRMCKKRCTGKVVPPEEAPVHVDEIQEGGLSETNHFLDDGGYEIPVPPPYEYDIPLQIFKSGQASDNQEASGSGSFRTCTLAMTSEDVAFQTQQGLINMIDVGENFTLSKPCVKMTLTVYP